MSAHVLACPDVIGGTPAHPVLLGNRCRDCGEPYFPAARGCTRCSSDELEACELGSTGTLWSWTIQLFPPKAPFDGETADGIFQAYGIGYVELANGLKVESRLVSSASDFAIGQPMRLVLQPYRKGANGEAVYTYAFEVAA
jgi:uncharacterized OB-fold protein